MRRGIKRYLCAFMTAAVMLGGIQVPAEVKAQESRQGEERTAATVTTCDELKKALAEKKSPITVKGNITIVNGAESSGRMLPIKIPQGTVIQGDGSGGLSSRCPIQLEGDGVCFKNIKLHFESTDALWSVPHREIYLAGHSLTLDNVDTYLEGGAEIGGIGGFETELLPTVYAGGYPGSALGSNASLTVKNSNDKTMFKAIYMGHGTENGTHVSYQGNAGLNLDAKAVVREGVDASQNSRALIKITGAQDSFAKAKKFAGNLNTTLTLDTVSIAGAAVDGVGNIVLENKSCLSPETQELQNVTLKNGACLDFTGVDNARVLGNFAGTESAGQERGILVLKPEGSVSIQGSVSGTTQFQTGHRLFPGAVLAEHPYINAPKGNESNFALAQKSIDTGFQLKYSNGIWKGYREQETEREIGKIEILSAPSKVDISQITDYESEQPNENIYFDIKWYDKGGEVFDDKEVVNDDTMWFYDIGYVVPIRTEYWEKDSSGDANNKSWHQPVLLVPSETTPGRYYLQKYGENELQTGDFTLLFSSLYNSNDLDTVADVKALKDTIVREQKVTFSSGQDSDPGHIHTFKGAVTKNPTCVEEGIMTYSCTYGGCTEKYTEKIAVSEHVYQEKVTQAATCTEPGIKTFECSVCKARYTEEIAALRHKEVIDPAVEPTETTEGKTEGSHCSVCNKVIKPQKVIPATGHKHSYSSSVTKKATCTETGVRTFTCNCGDQYTEEIPLAPHRYTEKRTPATMNSSGMVQQICSVCSNAGTAAIIASPRIAWGETDFSYDGKIKTPSVTVQDTKGKALKAGTDYQISYSGGRINPGVYTATVAFRGNYSGKSVKSFTVKPKKTSLKKASAKSKGMQVSWKKQTAQMDGYQLQYSTNASFKGKTTKLATAKKSAVSKKISKLKGKKKYYVRIRTYKTVNADGKKVKLYSEWSAKKSVKTKK